MEVITPANRVLVVGDNDSSGQRAEREVSRRPKRRQHPIVCRHRRLRRQHVGLSAARLVLTVHFVHVLIRRRVWDDRLSDNALLLRSPTSRTLPDHARRNLRQLRLPPLVSPPPPSPHVRRVLIPIPRLELPPCVFLSLPM